MFLFFLVKRYAFEIVKVNNKDMLSTYDFNDVALVKKTANDYKRGDVLYFEYPQHDSILTRTFFFQRLVGFPGDTVELINKQLFINSMPVSTDSTCQYNYFIKSNKVVLDSLFRLKYRLTEGGEISDDFDYSYSLTQHESALLRKDSLIKSAELKIEKKGSYDETCFPSTPHYAWNMDQYGKLYIPKLNDTLRLDSVNLHLYRDLISNHEKNKLELKHDSIFINDQHTTYYVVKKNYYFVMGDNRDNANDSRTWGFLPGNCIKGKIVSILKRNSK